MKYGARHLKRAIERTLVHPLVEPDRVQARVHGGDLIRVDFDPSEKCLYFVKEAEDMPAYAMVQMMEAAPVLRSAAAAARSGRIRSARRLHGKGHRIR